MRIRARKFYYFSGAFIIILFACILFAPPLTASAQGLMDAFGMKAFQGNWQFFGKLNFLGYAMQASISILSLLGLCSRCLTVLVTICYLCMKPLFNTVHEIKSQGGTDLKTLGMKDAYKNIINSTKGRGIDVLFYMVLALAPDLKEFSEYNETYRPKGLEDTDGVGTYVLKSSIPTVIQLFFLSMGFNGTLWRAYANVVDAMGVLAETVVEVELDRYVSRALAAGGAFPFAYDKDGTEYGKFMNSLAKDIYNKVMLKTPDLSQKSQQRIGTAICEVLKTKFGEIKVLEDGTISSTGWENFVPDFKCIDKDVISLSKSVNISQAPEYYSAAFTVSLEEDLGLEKAPGSEEDESWYVHVFLKRKQVQKGTNYWDEPATKKKK